MVKGALQADEFSVHLAEVLGSLVLVVVTGHEAPFPVSSLAKDRGCTLVDCNGAVTDRTMEGLRSEAS